MFWTCFGAIFSKIFCPVFHGWSSFQKFSKKSKKFQNSKKAQNRSKKYSNVFWTSFGANFSKNFCPVFHGVSSLRNFSKKLKKFQNSKNARNRSQKYSNVVWTSFGANFSKSFCPIFHGVSSLRNFSKKFKKFSKFQPKTHKTVPKRVQKCFEHVLGQIFRKIFKPSAPWRLETSKIFKKIKKNFNIPKRPKIVPKSIQTSSERVLGQFFRKNFAQFSMEGRVFENSQKKQRIFKVPKKQKFVTKSVQTCFELVLRQIFPKKILSQCSMEARVFENFQKIKKISKLQKCPKSFPKVFKRVLNKFWGKFFVNFCPVLHGGSSLRKFSEKLKKISKFQPKTHKTVPKRIQKCFEQVLLQIFRKNFAQFSKEGRVFENSQKKTNNFQSSKKAEIRYQKCPNVFWTCFGANFLKIFMPSVPWRVESSKIFKNIKKISKFQKYPKSFPKVSKRVLNKFGANFSKNFCPVFHGVSSLRNFSEKLEKFSKFQPKMHKTVPKRIQKCFEQVLLQIFRKNFAQFSKEGRVFEKFQKNQKKFKFPKMPKIVPKSIQTSSERVLGQFFRKTFAQCSMEGRVFENFQKKTKNFQSSKKAENRYQKCPNVFWTCFGANFSKKNCYPSVPWRLESSKIFKKIKKISKFQKCPKSFTKVSKRVLNVFWGNFFEKILPSVPWRLETSKSWKKPKNSQ